MPRLLCPILIVLVVPVEGLCASAFTLSADPAALALCASKGSADIGITVAADPGFADPVNLSATGQPAGSSVLFAPTAVSPPGTSTLTLGALDAAMPGDYSLVVTGESAGDESTATIALSLSAQVPAAPDLVAPAHGDPAQPQQPLLEWIGHEDAVNYLVVVATDPGFNRIMFFDLVDGTDVQVDAPLGINTRYYWRVTANNHCGLGAISTVRTFNVIGPDLSYADGFELPPDPIFTNGFEDPADSNILALGKGRLVR